MQDKNIHTQTHVCSICNVTITTKNGTAFLDSRTLDFVCEKCVQKARPDMFELNQRLNRKLSEIGATAWQDTNRQRGE